MIEDSTWRPRKQRGSKFPIAHDSRSQLGFWNCVCFSANMKCNKMRRRTGCGLQGQGKSPMDGLVFCRPQRGLQVAMIPHMLSRCRSRVTMDPTDIPTSLNLPKKGCVAQGARVFMTIGNPLKHGTPSKQYLSTLASLRKPTDWLKKGPTLQPVQLSQNRPGTTIRIPSSGNHFDHPVRCFQTSATPTTRFP